MHTHLDEHLHTPECVKLIHELNECRSGISKWTGGCDSIYQQLRLCLRGERIQKAELNAKIAKARYARLKEQVKKIDKNETFDEMVERIKNSRK